MSGRGHSGRGRGGAIRRPFSATPNAETDCPSTSSKRTANAQTTALFGAFQACLDTKYDRHERIVKLSRDVTIESKRAIFLLHRITTKATEEQKDQLLCDVWAKLTWIRGNLFHAIALELQGEDPYQYLRAYTGGLQEYIEAVSFHFFLKHQRLVDLDDVVASLSFDTPAGRPGEERGKTEEERGKPEEERGKTDSTMCTDGNAQGGLNDRGGDVKHRVQTAVEEGCSGAGGRQLTVMCPTMDYLLGIGDIGGEVMRYALNSVSGGQLDVPSSVAAFLRSIYGGFTLIGHAAQHRDFSFKTDVLRQSVIKVERAVYVLRLRAEEVPNEMLAQMAGRFIDGDMAEQQQQGEVY